jgi:hypothetical protein
VITKKTLCVGLLVLSIIFKFWLIAEMEITDDPDDPPNYVAQILVGGPSFFGPGTGCVGKLFRLIGIPFRDGIEVAYLVSCVLAVKALFDWPTRSYPSLGLFLFLSFNPAPEELFSHIMSDQVWLVEVLLGISLFVLFAETQRRRRWLYLVPAAVCLGFSTITRVTIIPLMAAFLLAAVMAAILYVVKTRRKAVDLQAIIGWIGCIGFIAIFNYSTCLYNSICYGYFGLSITDCREYRIFYMCLQSVGDPSGDKYYPVDDHRLSLVAQAGPVSHWFVDHMRTDLNFRRISQNAYGKYDFALPWFELVVFFNTVPNGDLRQGFAMFRMVENEISKAAEENRLKVRAIIPLPDSRIPIVLSAAPNALRQLSALITAEPAQYAWAWRNDEPKFDNPYFAQALTRRTVAPSPARENIGRALCTFYSFIYARLLFGLELSMGAYLVCGLYYWNKLPAMNLHSLAQQLFALFFFVVFFWYVLFSASGLQATSRYMVFQNVILPLLVVYYFREAWRIARGEIRKTVTPFSAAKANHELLP